MPRQTKPVPLCCVTVGYQSFLMPAQLGMKLVDLMNSAVICQMDYQKDGHCFTPKEQPRVEYVSVRPGQVIAPLNGDTAGHSANNNRGISRSAPLRLE